MRIALERFRTARKDPGPSPASAPAAVEMIGAQGPELDIQLPPLGAARSNMSSKDALIGISRIVNLGRKVANRLLRDTTRNVPAR